MRSTCSNICKLTNCVQIYHDKNILTLINHAGNNGFGGIGFKPINDKIRYKFANFLTKLCEKFSPVKEVQLIGCDVNKCFAQFIADACNMNIRTLPDLHEKFPDDIFGEGESMLKFFKDDKNAEYENLFLYGYVFKDFEKFEKIARIKNFTDYDVITVGSDKLVVDKGEQTDGYLVENLLDYVNDKHSWTNLYKPELKRKNSDKEFRSEHEFKTQKTFDKVNDLSELFHIRSIQ